MEAALAQWDRNISALEAQVKESTKKAPDLRAAQVHAGLGVAYATRGRLADALREFETAIRLRPSSSDVRVLGALTLEALGRPADAARMFEDAWTIDPRSGVKAYYVASRPGVDPAARAKARAFLSTLVVSGFSRTPPPAPAFVTLEAIPDGLSRAPIVGDEATADGFALLAAGRYKEAIAALMRGPRADSPRLHFARAQAAEATNRIADARREFQAALTGALAGRHVILIAIARLAQVEGDTQGAIDALTQAMRLNPNDAFTRKELAAALASDGKADDAQVELEAVLLIDAKDAQAHAAIGQLHLDAGRYDEAIAAFTRALELAPDRFEVRYSLATAYMRAGRDADAREQFELYDRARQDALEKRRKDLAAQ
jgi:tetratricopeptide (TPR) repeat protein